VKSEIHPTLRAAGIAILVAVAAVEVLPWLWMISTSLKPLGETLMLPPTLLPDDVRFENYVEVWESAPFGRYLFNSLWIATSIAVLQAALAMLAGYAFARLRFWGRDALFYVVLACMMIPAQVRFVSVFLMLDEVNLVNTYTAQILPHAVSGLGTFLMRQAFLAIPQDVIDAARIDGAGTLRIIFTVCAPIVAPTLVAFLLFSFVYHWNDYFWPLVMTLDETVRPLPLGVALLREQGTGSRWHLIMAGNVLLVAPLLVAFVAAQKRIVRAFVVASLK
jgi:sn-glycerol 3-phosphate transport system permease protein